MKKITKIERNMPLMPTRKRVAAYARVSKDTERLMNSVSAQISHYSELIQNNPEWEYTGVYADFAITGTMTDKRDEFKRLIKDCDAGKIDIILCKSISRFARNTVDLLETVRHLKNIGVEVQFEKENINSLSAEGEFMLTLLASFAQEEVTSLSENSKWGIRRRFQNGEIGMANKHILGYKYDDEKRQYVIIPEEAEIVRKMFQMYIDGISLRDIAKRLNADGYRGVRGFEFSEFGVNLMLKNEIYAGDIKRQKTFIEDPIRKRKVKNLGQLPQYYMQDCHEAIIDRETYKQVLAEMERRAGMLNPTYCFTKKMKCAVCGRSFTRKKSMVKGNVYIDWICRSKKEKGVTCKSHNYRESYLKKVCSEVLGINDFDDNVFNDNIKKIIARKDGSLEFVFKGGKSKIWNDKCKLETRHIVTSTDAFIGKIFCKKCGNTYHRVNSGGKWVYWYCIGKKRKGQHCDNINYADYHLRNISAFMLETDDFNEDVFTERVDKITVLENGDLEYKFTDGGIKTWQRK